jgi:hypothetical protein
MKKAEEIYHRFVNYEWNEIGEAMKVSIIKAIDEALKEGQKLPIHSVSNNANVLRLCVCLPLAQCFNLTTNLMGQIAQNRCYA